MNQADEFVIDGSEEPTNPRRGVRRRDYTPLIALAVVATVCTGLGAVLGYRAGKKRGKGD